MPLDWYGKKQPAQRHCVQCGSAAKYVYCKSQCTAKEIETPNTPHGTSSQEMDFQTQERSSPLSMISQANEEVPKVLQDGKDKQR